MALYLVVSTDKVYIDLLNGRVLSYSNGDYFDADPSLPTVITALKASPPKIIEVAPTPNYSSELPYETISFTGGVTGSSGNVSDLKVNWFGSTDIVEVRIAAPCVLRLATSYIYSTKTADSVTLRIQKNGVTVVSLAFGAVASGAQRTVQQRPTGVTFAAGDMLEVRLDATNLSVGNSLWTSVNAVIQYTSY